MHFLFVKPTRGRGDLGYLVGLFYVRGDKKWLFFCIIFKWMPHKARVPSANFCSVLALLKHPRGDHARGDTLGEEIEGERHVLNGINCF